MVREAQGQVAAPVALTTPQEPVSWEYDSGLLVRIADNISM